MNVCEEVGGGGAEYSFNTVLDIRPDHSFIKETTTTTQEALSSLYTRRSEYVCISVCV